jgi:uncharacterized protein (TIGR01732 family)
MKELFQNHSKEGEKMAETRGYGNGNGSTFVLIVILFILLVIIGAVF